MNITDINLKTCEIGYNRLSSECVYRNFCSQYSHHFFTWGIIILTTYFLLLFFSSRFFNGGYKTFCGENSELGNILSRFDDEYINRWWHNNVWNWLQMILIAYIFILTYINKP